MGYLANLLVKIGVDNSELNGGMDKATRSVNKFAGDVESAGRRLAVGLTLPIAGLGLAAVKAAGDMEQTKVAFTTLLKSADAASAHIKELTKFSLVTPYQLEDLTKASRLMMAYGFAASDVVPKLRTIGNAVSALGGGSEMLERVIRSVGEIGTRGKITGEQLRELSRAGIPALEAIANKLGVSMAEAQKKVTAGAVDAKVAMDGLMEYMDRRFAGGMEAQSRTMLGAWSNTKEKINLALIDIGNTLLPVAQRMMSAIDPILDRVKSLAEEFAKLPTPVQNTTLALGGLTAVLPLVMIALGSTITNTIAVAGAFSKIVGLATKLGPLLLGPGGVALGLAAIGIAGYKAGEYLQNRFGSGVDAATESVKRLNTEVGKSVIAGMATHGGAAPNTGGLGKWIMDSSIQAVDAMKKTAGAVVDIDKMLTDAGMATMAERRKNLDDAKALYAAVVKEYGAGSVIAIQALQKVNDAQAQLIPTLKEVKNHAQGLFAFGSKGIESAIIVEGIKQATHAEEQYIAAVVKAGGLSKYNAEQAAKEAEAYKMLGEPPVLEGIGKLAAGLKDIVSASLPIDPQIKRINEALERLGVAGRASHVEQLREDFDVLGGQIEKGVVSVDTYIRAWINLVKAMDAAGEYIDPAAKAEVIRLERQYGGQLGETRKQMGELAREGERVFHAISRGIASSVVNLKGWGETFKNIAKDTAQSVLTIMIEGLFKKLAKELADLLANTKGVLGSIGKWLGGLVGGGGSAAASAATGSASAASGAAGSIGGASKAASSGVMGAIGVGAQVGTMISSIVGNFQSAAQNKSLDVLVNHTLRIFNVVNQGLEEHYLFKGQLFAKLDDVWRTLLDTKDILGRGITTSGGKSGVTFNNCTFNGTSPQAMMQAAFDQFALAQGA